MPKPKRLILIAIVIASFSAIAYGFYLKKENELIAHKYIGGGTFGLFLVAMPFFLITESKGKKMEDYMLTKENIEKMRKNERGGKENS